MFKKNSLVSGLAIGIVFPLIAWICFDVIFKGFLLMGKPGIPYLIAIAFNLVIIKYAARREADRVSQGVMIVTFICMVLVFIFKMKI